ncbi:LRP2BP [Branchiostoma lanceolatum]|uniref:LRP2-binding protein n=1 Tax=Branchiostoma lanceolatum TaxID=7740 RepID=A0A8K0EMN9_BRALA|nr:LRP2BP [Branchiostoma lanceolatum]
MEKQIPGEPLPSREPTIRSSFGGEQSTDGKNLVEQVEAILQERIRNGDQHARFTLGQFYFEEGLYKEAIVQFERLKEKDWQAMYQLGVMYYDGLGTKENHKLACEYMRKVASSESQRAKHLIRAAQYNLGRAYFQGYGVAQSDSEAEKWWILSADDGNPEGSVRAMTMLGMFYSREDTKDLKKAFFWHSEACGAGSLESQGALGVMYEHGQGKRRDPNSAFECLKEASERGSVYAMGNLVAHYFNRKLYTKAADLAAKVSQYQQEDVQTIAAHTDCIPGFIAKGIAMACFLYARCLHMGHGVRQNKEEAKTYYSKAFTFDPDMTAMLQNQMTHGRI